MSRTFEVKGAQVEGVQVQVPAGRAAYDLETGRTVTGPATVWQRVKPEAKKGGGMLITEEERRVLAGEKPESQADKPGRGRPPVKKSAAPPDL